MVVEKNQKDDIKPDIHSGSGQELPDPLNVSARPSLDELLTHPDIAQAGYERYGGEKIESPSELEQVKMKTSHPIHNRPSINMAKLCQNLAKQGLELSIARRDETEFRKMDNVLSVSSLVLEQGDDVVLRVAGGKGQDERHKAASLATILLADPHTDQRNKEFSQPLVDKILQRAQEPL